MRRLKRVLRRFGFARAEPGLEAAAQLLPRDPRRPRARPPSDGRLELDDAHRSVACAVAAEVALDLGQASQPSDHTRKVRRTADTFLPREARYGSRVAPNVRAKEFRYATELDESGRVTADGAAPLELEDAWTPEHLVLAGLTRCSLQSLRYHAGRAGIAVRGATGSAAGRVTKRDSDERYAFVEVECRLAVELDPEPDANGREELLAKAERDCFVGASLSVTPRYDWSVNGARASDAGR